MKEKRTYKRFDFPSFLAILGCIGMILFECVFIFELYDRAVLQPEVSVPEQPVPAGEAPSSTPAPAEVPPAQIETAPAAVPVG